jgi:hypothetical protein
MSGYFAFTAAIWVIVLLILALRVVISAASLALTAAALVNQGITPVDLHTVQPTLEDVFVSITGQSMLS